MIRTLALGLGVVVVLVLVFGSAEETPAALPQDGRALTATPPEPETLPDPFTQLPRLLTMEAEAHELTAKFSAMMQEVYAAWTPDGEFSDAEAAPVDRLRVWITGASNELGPTVRNLRLATVSPELKDYAEALHAYALALVRSFQIWRTDGERELSVSALNDALVRLNTARARVVRDALPPGLSRDYVSTFGEHLNGSKPAWAVDADALAYPSADPEAWEAAIAALESEAAGWSAVRPPGEWANFHDRWSEALAAGMDAYRLQEPGRLPSANVAAAALTEVSAVRWTLVAEWLTLVAAEVAVAHPPSGS